MKPFIHTLLGILIFASVTTTGALAFAYLVKSFFQLTAEGRYLFLVFVYLLGLTNNWLLTRLQLPSVKNIVVFGAVLIVGFIAFIELTVFSRSSSVYQLYYAVGLIPLMYVFANYRLDASKKSAK